MAGPQAVIKTKFGDITIELFEDLAPGHVKNFLDLAGKGFYNQTIFHRVIPGFMIQGGCPNSKPGASGTPGTGGPGYHIDAEFSSTKHVRGILSMARASDPNSAGCQFFVVVKDSLFLDNQYTAFGRVLSGMEVADQIVSLPRNAQDLPKERVEMTIEAL
ncbi:MAG: peptidylprolyl isomerase [bacterium]